MNGSTYNILMYSHDSYGLGHIRRSMAIARSLGEQDVNILIITGSPIVGRFDVPERVDFVRVPGMIKQGSDLYVSSSIRIEAWHAMAIRQSIIKATARAFDPDLFIVDKAPLGLKREILPTLQWLRRPGSRTVTVLGLRDIMDDAESTQRDWRKKGVYNVLDRYYTEIWIYGNRDFYDPIREYGIPSHVAEKVVFTGYIPRLISPEVKATDLLTPESRSRKWKPMVLVTAGGGGDGYPLMDTFLRLLEEMRDPPFRTVMVAGPFISREQSDDLQERSRRLGVRFHTFYRRMEKLYAASDLVVCMGGYNTFCEVMSHGKVALLVPRESPRLEQRIRAEVMGSKKLVDFLPWAELAPASLKARVLKLLEQPEPYLEAIRDFPLTGLEVMRRRLTMFRDRGQQAVLPLVASSPSIYGPKRPYHNDGFGAHA